MRDSQWRVVLAVVAISLVAASCSATDDLLGNDVDETIDSEVAETRAEVEVGSESVDQGDGAQGDVVAEPTRPSIWVRGDDAVMRPTSPSARMSELMAPGGGWGWTVVGSIYDYDTGTNQPVVWSADDPESSDSWTRTELEQPGGRGAQMSAAVRTEGFDVVVGSHGQDSGQRPAVWVRSAGDQWRSIDWAQFDRAAPAWLSHVTVHRSNGLLLAVGGQANSAGKAIPTLWVSSDGEEWQAVEQLPFAADGTENFRGLTAGSTTSVLTGQREAGSTHSATAYWSDDGRTWVEAEVEKPTDGGESYLREVTWFNDRFVAVGGVSTAGVFRPTSWTSTDGEAWSLHQTPFELADNGRVTTAGFGALRVTSTDSTVYATANSAFLQHLWQSSDGVDWSVIDDITEFRSEGVDVYSMAAVDDQVLLVTSEPGIVIHDDGYADVPLRQKLLPKPDQVPWVADITHDGTDWVAVGGASVQQGFGGGGGTRSSAREWRSTDGVSWEVTERLPEASTGAMEAVAPWAGGLAAVGAESQRSATTRKKFGSGLIWQFSESSWDELGAPSASDDVARIGLQVVAAAGDDLLAGGWRFAPGGDDGTDAFLLQSDAQAAPKTVDIGYHGSDNEALAALCGAESGVAVALVAVQQLETHQVASVRRNPEREWADAEWLPSPPGTQPYVTDCAYGIDGFLAVGTIDYDTDENVGLWHSADGSVWEQVDGPPGFSASGNQWVTSMAVTEAGYLLAGDDASSGVVQPSIWYGSGDDWQQTIIAEAETMYGLQVAFANGTIVVVGWNDGGEQVYSTTLDQLVTELNQ
ncbi:MAG: hypothetical protein ACRBK7_07185 [Acidimicrobiales bacterium]